MNRPELIRAAAAKAGITIANTDKALSGIVEAIMEAVAAGTNVRIIGFGNFEPVERAAKKARNPRTGETVMIKSRKVPVFKASKEFKSSVMDA